MAERTPHTVHLTDEPLVDWTKEPVFDFISEVEALEMIAAIGDELRDAREHARHCMRYMAAAVQAARQVTEDGKKINPQAIINHSGLARQTVYNLIGKDEPQ
jgi:hypothetical protein